MSVTEAPVKPDPRRYFEAVDARRSRAAETPPVCLYLEVTNRCNLLCETCPRTFEALEPPKDMDWDLFTRIVDQLPNLARVVLHGVGEPMLVKTLPQMIRYLKDRGTYVLFNTNGTLLAPRKRREIIDTGLDELRVSLDAAEAASFLRVRGKDMFDRIVRNISEFTELQRKIGAATPRVSLWLTGLKETVDELPEFVRLAARIGVTEVHLPGIRRSGARAGAGGFFAFRDEPRRGGSRHCRSTGAGGDAGCDAGCLGCDGAGAEPEARRGGDALGDVPAAVVADVFHRARARPALLHRTVFRARLRNLHAGRRHAAEPARDLERGRVSGFPREPAGRYAAEAVPELRAALEPVSPSL
jgi:organic radical activating enzyme